MTERLAIVAFGAALALFVAYYAAMAVLATFAKAAATLNGVAG